MRYRIKKQKKSSGFTLIEMMIVVAISGVLSAIAYPNYTRYVLKSKRTDAMVAVMQAAQIQEKYFSQNLRYAKDATQLGVGAESDNALYDIVVSGTDSAAGVCTNVDTATSCVTYAVVATAKASQSRDLTCRTFSLTNTGAKSSQNWDGTTLSANSSHICW